MPAQVITITSGKGGVGKTTAVANLAVALALDGAKVVCIDGDIGLRNLDVILGLENRIVYDIVDVIEGRCRLRQAMIRDKKLPELYLIPAAQTRDKNAVSPSDMNRLIKDLRNDYDFVLIDSPAGIERGFRNAIAAADRVLVVTNPEVSAVRDADRVIGLLEAVSRRSAYLSLMLEHPPVLPRLAQIVAASPMSRNMSPIVTTSFTTSCVWARWRISSRSISRPSPGAATSTTNATASHAGQPRLTRTSQ